MELHRFFRYAIEKMCKEKKSLNHFISIALAFSPFIVTFLYIIIFGTICICKLYIFISKIEAFRADFNKVVTGLTPKETFEYVSHRNVESFEFYKFEGPKDSNN